MPGAKCIQKHTEFMTACYEAQGCLKLIMEGHNPATVLAGKPYMEWYNRIEGMFKLNVFLLVPAPLYKMVKDHQWGAYANDWTGFRSVPEKDGKAILNKTVPTKDLPGGTTLEVGGYEKQPTDKYYSASEPSLNLEFKYNSGELWFREDGGVVTGRPKLSYGLNVHVKQVAAPRNTY